MCFRPASFEGGFMKCPVCGTDIPKEATSCPACGATEGDLLGALAPPSAPGAPPMAPRAPSQKSMPPSAPRPPAAPRPSKP